MISTFKLYSVRLFVPPLRVHEVGGDSLEGERAAFREIRGESILLGLGSDRCSLGRWGDEITTAGIRAVFSNYVGVISSCILLKTVLAVEDAVARYLNLKTSEYPFGSRIKR